MLPALSTGVVLLRFFRDRHRPALTDDDDEAFPACNCGVGEVSGQHGVMLRRKGDDDGRIFGAAPTSSKAALDGIDFRTASMSETSTMLVSSMTSRSQSRGYSALRLKPPCRGSSSSRR